ncbi:MAG: PrgI family protein [Clostridia bacterium]|nr:PrgI family protein [Clostridia bacterium]
MGNSYFVPRNVKGESRILYIFTMKSFIFTLAAGVVGIGVWFLISSLFAIDSLVAMLICVAIFAVIGYLLGALKIPDSPIMGIFRKAGGEYLSDIILRFITFGGKKKIYLYNYNREKSVTEEMQADKKEARK